MAYKNLSSKGDIFVFNGTTLVRLPVGANGKSLVADSTASQGLSYSSQAFVEGTGQTIGAVTADLITIDMGATPGTYSLAVNVSVFESTTPAGAQYFLIGAARTDGISATIVEIPDQTISEEAALVAADCDIVVSGNNVIVRATGVALLTVNWAASATVVIRS